MHPVFDASLKKCFCDIEQGVAYFEGYSYVILSQSAKLVKSVNVIVFWNSTNPAVSILKVTSKGAGLNPNAKVWQEMPVAPSEAVTSSPHWPPSDINEGERDTLLSPE